MGLFSNTFKQLLFTVDKKNNRSLSDRSSTSNDNKKKRGVIKLFSSRNLSLQASKNKKESISNTANTDTSTSSIQSSQKTSKEGKSFKYNAVGRRYHGDDEVAYFLPNDDDETDRLHQQHWILRYVLQRNFHAPVKEMLERGIKVLDSGCGPATWAFELAERYPLSQFYGVDISCVFPEAIKPANVDFVIANIAKEIPYPNNTFDYIHQRLLLAALTDKDWENRLQSLKELYRVLKPGGYIELAEFCLFDLVNIGPNFTKLQTANMAVFGTLGMPIRICEELESRLLKAGFVNQVLQITPLPINHDGKGGELLWSDARHGYTNIRLAMERVHKEWHDPQVYEDFLEACGQEANKMKSSVNWYACYAQKPLV